MAKRKPTQPTEDLAFGISDPPAGARLGASFGVLGDCPELEDNEFLTVTVRLSFENLDGDVVQKQKQAVTNADALTWEAFFDNVEESEEYSGELIAHCSEGDFECDPVIDLTIDTVDAAGLEVEFPQDGDVIIGPVGGGGGRPVETDAPKPKAKGKHRKNRVVCAFATRGGERVAEEPVEVDSTEVSTGKKPWELKFDTLFEDEVTEGQFGLHYLVEAPDGRTHRVSRGSFVVQEPEDEDA
jgi:hypothetical protein